MTFFVVDLIATFPFDVILGDNEDGQSKLVRLTRLPRLIRIVGILKLVKIGKLFCNEYLAVVLY